MKPGSDLRDAIAVAISEDHAPRPEDVRRADSIIKLIEQWTANEPEAA